MNKPRPRMFTIILDENRLNVLADVLKPHLPVVDLIQNISDQIQNQMKQNPDKPEPDKSEPEPENKRMPI